MVEEDEPVAHMIDIEPVLMLNCSKSELSYCGLFSVLAWFVIFTVIFLLLGIPASRFVLVGLLGLLFGMPSGYYAAKYLGKKKRGRPHMYYKHVFEMSIMSRLRRSYFISHTGYFGIGRTLDKSEGSNVSS